MDEQRLLDLLLLPPSPLLLCPASFFHTVYPLVDPHSRLHATSALCASLGDVKRINDIAVRAPCTGMIIVGGGLVKHHVCNANLMRNGADFAVFMNTGTRRISKTVSAHAAHNALTPTSIYLVLLIASILL